MTDQVHAGIGAQGLAAQKASTVRWRIFGIVFALVVINLIDRVTLSIAMPTISKEFSL
jgi:ACS family D-galactonate transporter-like MFS transporter